MSDPEKREWFKRVDEADAEAEHQWEKTKWVVDEVARGEELVVVAQALRALPQIVAVVDQFEAFVEILERSRDPWKEIEERLRNVAPELLSALDEALS